MPHYVLLMYRGITSWVCPRVRNFYIYMVYNTVMYHRRYFLSIHHLIFYYVEMIDSIMCALFGRSDILKVPVRGVRPMARIGQDGG